MTTGIIIVYMYVQYNIYYIYIYSGLTTYI